MTGPQVSPEIFKDLRNLNNVGATDNHSLERGSKIRLSMLVQVDYVGPGRKQDIKSEHLGHCHFIEPGSCDLAWQSSGGQNFPKSLVRVRSIFGISNPLKVNTLPHSNIWQAI